ncbi:MAG: TonB-dependent receptor [Chloroflexi bacterium]|nr:TonB-dependent receptor [Chloroflexota bacterium]
MRAADSRCIRRLVVAAGWSWLTFGLMAGPVHAQIDTGLIVGIVTDESDAALPGVTVTVQNLSTGQTRTTVTGPQGRYQFASLQATKYSVKAELSGFATVVHSGITVNIGSAVDVNIRMKVAGVEETVTVTGEAPQLESTKTALGNIITQEDLENLPSKQRAFLDFTLLMPATVENVTMDGGTGAVIGGARTVEGLLLVDGFYNMDESFANAKQRHSQDVIQEFQVVTFGGSAEYGRAIGGVINAITKSGGNALRGTAYGFFRTTSLNAQDWGEKARGTPKTEYDRQQWGGTLGGRIIKDKSFYFLAYERTVENWPYDNRIKQSDADIIGLAPGDVGTTPRYFYGNFLFGKVDHAINDNQRFLGSVSWSRNFDHQINFAVLDLATPSVRHIQNTVDLAFLGKWTMVASNGHMLHEIKVSYSPRDYSTDGLRQGGPPLVPDGEINEVPLSNSSPPRVQISNVAQFGSVALNNVINTKPLQAIYTSTIFGAKHTWKFGADYMYAPYEYLRYSPFRGAYSFSSLSNYVKGVYSTFAESFGDPANNRAHNYLSAFVQDTWQASKRLTINCGLRYDLEFNPKAPQTGEPYGNDYNNFGPRFAISYDLTNKGTTFVKLTSGVYYDRIWGNATSNFYTLKGHETLVAPTWTPTTPGAPIYPQVFAERPANMPAGITDVIVMPDRVNVPLDAQVVGSI